MNDQYTDIDNDQPPLWLTGYDRMPFITVRDRVYRLRPVLLGYLADKITDNPEYQNSLGV